MKRVTPPESFSLKDAAKHSPAKLGLPFKRGDLLMVSPSRTYAVAGSRLAMGPHDAMTSFLQFENADPALARRWWALMWTADGSGFELMPMEGESSMAAGPSDGPFSDVRVIPATAPHRQRTLQRGPQALFGSNQQETLQFLWNKLPESERERLSSRHQSARVCKKLPSMRIGKLLHLLGATQFEAVLGSKKCYYCCGDLGGRILCAGTDGKGSFELTVKVQQPQDPEDLRSERVRLITRFTSASHAALEPHAREATLAPGTPSCPVHEPLSMMVPPNMLVRTSRVFIAFPNVDPAASDGREEKGAVEALFPEVSCRAMWRVIDPKVRHHVWHTLAGKDPHIATALKLQATDAVKGSDLAHRPALKAALRLWSRMSVFHRLVMAKDGHDTIGVRSLRAFIRTRNKVMFANDPAERAKQDKDLRI